MALADNYSDPKGFPINDDGLNTNGISWQDLVWLNPPFQKLDEEQKQRGRQAIEDSIVDWEEAHTENFN